MKQSRIIGTVLAAANGVLILLCAIFYLGKDRQGPEFTFQSVDTVYRKEIEREELLKGVTAWDKEDGDLSSRIVIEKISENREEGTAVVFYAASDKAGNVARASRVFEAAFAELDEGNVEGKYFDAGIEAELKEGDVENTGAAGKETENSKKDKEGVNEEDNYEDTVRDGMHDNTQQLLSPTPAIGREEEQAHEEPENLPEAVSGTETEQRTQTDQEAGNAAGSQAPVLSLKVSEVEVKAGQGPAWVDLIETLSDDKDGYETLFRNLNVSRYDRNKPGAYQVSVLTEDSDGNQSEAVPLTIIVK